MKLNAIQTHEEICKWIASSKTDQQLDVLSLFITDTFSKRFPELHDNVLHGQLINNMMSKIEEKRQSIHVNEVVKQRFPTCDEQIEYTSPVNDQNGH